MVSILSELNKINFISPIVHTVPVAQFSRCFAGDFRKLLKVVRELSSPLYFPYFFCSACPKAVWIDRKRNLDYIQEYLSSW